MQLLLLPMPLLLLPQHHYQSQVHHAKTVGAALQLARLKLWTLQAKPRKLWYLVLYSRALQRKLAGAAHRTSEHPWQQLGQT